MCETECVRPNVRGPCVRGPSAWSGPNIISLDAYPDRLAFTVRVRKRNFEKGFPRTLSAGTVTRYKLFIVSSSRVIGSIRAPSYYRYLWTCAATDS